MKASLCYHKRQGRFTPVWLGASGQIENVREFLSIEQVEEFGIGQSGFADAAFDDVLRQIETLVGRNRDTAGLCLSA